MPEAVGMVSVMKTAGAVAGDGDTAASVQGDIFGGFGLARRGPGRPKGAENRSTTQWKRHLLQKYGSPLEGLMDLASMLTEPRRLAEFAVQMNIELGEAVKVCAAAASAAAPYVHQKLPMASEGDGRTPQPMVLRIGGERPVIPVRPRLVDPIAETETYQRVSAMQPRQSDAEQSDDATNSLNSNDEAADVT